MLAVARRVPPGEAVAAAGLVGLATLVVGPRPLLLAALWLALVTPRLVEIDLAQHRLPDAIVLPGVPIVLAAVLLDAATTGAGPAEAVLAGLAAGAGFLLLHLVGGLGLGDVKLAPVLGVLTAAAVPGGALLWVVGAFLLGGLAAAVVLVRRGAGARMAFGPPMLAAAWAVLVLG